MSVTNPEGETTTTIYDGVGRAVLRIDAEGDAVRTFFDVIDQNNALHVSGVIRDPNGLDLTRFQVTDGLGRTLFAGDELAKSCHGI